MIYLICNGENIAFICISLSGGPLMGEDSSDSLNPYLYLVGVRSFGPSRCETVGVPGVYTVFP